MSEKLSEAQRWILTNAAKGIRVVAGAGYEHHSNFATGDLWLGAPASAHRICVKRGWLENDLITDAGRRALQDQPHDL